MPAPEQLHPALWRADRFGGLRDAATATGFAVAGVPLTKAVLAEFEKLAKELAPHRIGLLHGRLSAEEKEAAMAGFRANEVRVLLATSVIEVGVDVPNATVMLVENAERFGLAQLHQLRGRIGRGAHRSSCVLFDESKEDNEEARARLFDLREIWLRVITECRDELVRPDDEDDEDSD